MKGDMVKTQLASRRKPFLMVSALRDRVVDHMLIQDY